MTDLKEMGHFEHLDDAQFAARLPEDPMKPILDRLDKIESQIARLEAASRRKHWHFVSGLNQMSNTEKPYPAGYGY